MSELSTQPNRLDEIYDLVLRTLEDIEPDLAGARPDTDLVNAGLDSLSMVKFIVRIEADLGICFSSETLTPEHFRSPGAIATAIAIAENADR